MKATSPVIAVLTTLLAAWGATADESTPPDATLSEKTQRELLQIDLTIDGPAHVVSQLAVSDFSVRINRKPADIVAIDRICADSATALEDGTRATRYPETEGGPPTPHGSFLFYFDQHFLTPEGRERSITLAKTLVEVAFGGWTFVSQGLSESLMVAYLPGSHLGGIVGAGLLIAVQSRFGRRRRMVSSNLA